MSLYRTPALLDPLHLQALFPDAAGTAAAMAAVSAAEAVLAYTFPASAGVFERAKRIQVEAEEDGFYRGSASSVSSEEDLPMTSVQGVLALDERQWFLHLLRSVVRERGLLVTSDWALVRPTESADGRRGLLRVAGVEATAAFMGYDARQPPPDPSNLFVEDDAEMKADPGLLPTAMLAAAMGGDGLWADSRVDFGVVDFGGVCVDVATGEMVDCEDSLPRMAYSGLGDHDLSEPLVRASLHAKATSMLRRAVSGSGLRTRDIHGFLIGIGLMMQPAVDDTQARRRRMPALHLVNGHQEASLHASILRRWLAFPGLNFARWVERSALGMAGCGPVVFDQPGVDLGVVSRRHLFVYACAEAPKAFSGEVIPVVDIRVDLTETQVALVVYAALQAHALYARGEKPPEPARRPRKRPREEDDEDDDAETVATSTTIASNT